MERKLEPRRILTPASRAARTRRILARRREGWTYREIGRAEGLTGERIGQIVRKGLDASANAFAEAGADRRVRPVLSALRFAGRTIGRGDPMAIDPLIRAVDAFRGRPATDADDRIFSEEHRERLLAHLNRRAAEFADTDARRAPAFQEPHGLVGRGR